jgi:hypothetical protein
MGQYYTIANLDAKEYVKPRKLGSGLKLWEISMTNVPQILPYLLRETDSSGGGDPRVRLERDPDMDVEEQLEIERRRTAEVYSMMGNWAGDRVVFLGDYTERESEEYGNLYQEVQQSEEWTDVSRTVAKEVADFIDHEDKNPEVPKDPQECDHEDPMITRYSDEETYGDFYCRECHMSKELETEEELGEIRA